ncbi:MAG: hypothetical protein LBD31_01380 [Treponema sp.]|jgi:hypothetical protein|nr:hypothetical protein [Treponema sp.]
MTLFSGNIPFVPAILILLFLGSCEKPELAVWSAYPEFEKQFSAAAEISGRIRVNYRAPRGRFGESSLLEPGIFVLDRNDLEALLNKDLILDLTGIHGQWQTLLPPLVYEGRILGFFFNAGTGVLCYDPRLAEKYLRVSQPAAVQALLGDLNLFIASAFLVSQRSFGSCAVLPSADELEPSFRNVPGFGGEGAERWFADIRQIFQDRRWEGLEFENGRPRRTLAFFLPPGSFFIPPGGGDAEWRVIRGPNPAGGEGIWIALHRDVFVGGQGRAKRIGEYLNVFFRILENPR